MHVYLYSHFSILEIKTYLTKDNVYFLFLRWFLLFISFFLLIVNDNYVNNMLLTSLEDGYGENRHIMTYQLLAEP